MADDVNVVHPASSTSDLPSGFSRNGPIITAANIKSNYLWGVKLSDADGNEIPDSVVDNHILNAISFLEIYLNVNINPVEYTEFVDYRREDWSAWNFLVVNHYPIISIASFQVRFIKDESTLDFPEEWYRIQRETGQIQLTPTAGTLEGWLIGLGNVLLTPGGSLVARKDFPNLFKIVYTAGFEAEKVPYAINNLVGILASVKCLAQLGNLVIAPGIGGTAIGLDGLSESTSRAEPNPYQGIMDTYMNEFNQQAEIIKNYYKRINCYVV